MKKNTTISVDIDLLKKAKELSLNMSGEFNAYMRNRITPRMSDLEEENLKVVCSECDLEISEGYKCKDRGLILCNGCQETFKMQFCPHDTENMHEHNKWRK